MAKEVPEDIISQVDPGRVQTDIGFYETIFRFHDQKMQHCIPAIVKEYDRATGKVTVQPIVQCVCDTTKGTEYFSRPAYDVQVLRMCHGGFTVDLPLHIGDTGWLIAGDRNAETAKLNNSKQNLKDMEFDDDGNPKGDDGNKGEMPPDDRSLSDFAWGLFIPDFWGDTKLAKEDGAVIKFDPNENSADEKPVKITITGKKIEIVRGVDGEEADVITIDDDGFHFSGKTDRKQQFLTDVKYDKDSHQIQKKVVECEMRGDLTVRTSEESDWDMIPGGQAERYTPETPETSPEQE